MSLVAALLLPLTPAEIERQERERIAKRKPHLALATSRTDPRPDPDVYRWWTVDELMERAR